MVIRANLHNRLCTSVLKYIGNDLTTNTNDTVAFIMSFFLNLIIYQNHKGDLFLISYDNIVIFNYIHIITISSYKSHDCCHMLHNL